MAIWRRLRFWSIAAISLISGGLVLLEIYPLRPNSVAGWVVLFLVAAPLLIVLELLGDRLLENRIVSRLPKAARIAYGVVAVLAGLVAILGGLRLVEPHMSSWR